MTITQEALQYILESNAQAQQASMNVLASTVRQLGVTAHLSIFDGSDPKRTRTWLRDAEKWRLIHNATDKEAVEALLISARGTVSDFIQRFLNNTPEPQRTWANLKKNIIANFADSTGVEFALEDLSNIKQRKNETIPAFLERLHQLSSTALADVDMKQAGAKTLTDKLLVHHFLYGLQSDNVRKCILKANCSNLDEAAEVARIENDVDRRANIRSRNYQSEFNFNSNEVETDMEVNHARRRPTCTICNKHHETGRCFKRQTNVIQPNSPISSQKASNSTNFQRRLNQPVGNKPSTNAFPNQYTRQTPNMKINERPNFQFNQQIQRQNQYPMRQPNFSFNHTNQNRDRSNFYQRQAQTARPTTLSYQTQFNGICWLCNRQGHKKANCWSNPMNKRRNLNA